ncbi:hypothetical protein AB3S75_015942 [Citrus x aurantiifolia]
MIVGIPVEKEHVPSIQTDDNRTADDEDIETLIARSNSHSRKSPTFGPIRQITATFGAMCHKLHMMLWNGLMHLAPSIKVIRKEKVRNMQAVEIVRIICKGVIWNDPQNQQLLKKTFFKAATLGISKFVQEIIAAYKGSVYWEDENKHTIFHVAVFHRRAEVFNLIYSSTFKSNWLGIEDNNRNNILHFAGKLVPSSEVAGAALQMQRELEWFKAVENLVHPFLREAVNNDQQTPREVFTKEHKELVKEGQKWMKETATSCSVVAALIITVMFAAAFTVPGGNNSRGIANFLHESSFIIFAVSDALSLFSSIISVLMFLGILTSRYSEEDFLLSLPRKLIIGLIAMFFSIASMMVSFGATIYLVLFSTWKWVFIPIALVGCVPVTLFALLQFPLLVDMYSSTYGRGIFGRK